MDVIKRLAIESVLGKIQNGEWEIENLEQTGSRMAIVVRTDTREQAVSSVSSAEKPKRQKVHVSKESRERVKQEIYDFLSPDKDGAKSASQIGGYIELGNQATNKFLREMEKEGKVKEVSGFKTKNFRWIRTPLKLHAGEGVK